MWLSITSTNSGENRIVEVPKSEVLIGSGAECDVVLEGADILRQHARVIHAGHHHFLIVQPDENGNIEPVFRETLSEHGTNYHWNGRERRIDLHEFEVGEFVVHVSGPPADLVDRRPITLAVGYGDGEPAATFDYDVPDVLIGSDLDCDLVLEGDGIFPQHARVVRSVNAFLLVEVRDENGEIAPVLRDTLNEDGSYYDADGRNIVVDNEPFRVGPFSVRVTSPL